MTTESYISCVPFTGQHNNRDSCVNQTVPVFVLSRKQYITFIKKNQLNKENRFIKQEYNSFGDGSKIEIRRNEYRQFETPSSKWWNSNLDNIRVNRNGYLLLIFSLPLQI